MGIKVQDSPIVKTSRLDLALPAKILTYTIFYEDSSRIRKIKKRRTKRIKLHPNLLTNNFYDWSYKILALIVHKG